MSTYQTSKIKVGVSSCLLGERVRFDSGHKKDKFIKDTLSDYFTLEPFCPEVNIGMTIPREPIRLIATENQTRCVGTKDANLDVTDKLEASAEKQKEWHATLSGYILKKDSPSCGMERVKVYSKGAPSRTGVGIYANRMMKNFPHLPVEEEGRLNDPRLRENFIQHVYIYSRWQALASSGITIAKLQIFHARHKYIFMSHNQLQAKKLGALLAQVNSNNLEESAAAYLDEMTTTLRIVPTRKGHTNTLQHLQGYLKKVLTTDDRQELASNIQQYRNGYVPLIVPMTLLRHHFRCNPNNYIDQSHYLQPHPKELMLLNSL